MPGEYPSTVADLTADLKTSGYLADRGLATTLYVALKLRRPVLLEGEVGVGKTEAAKALATTYGKKLIRLQCYEGIDTSQAIYEWDYARQMMHIRALQLAPAADAREASDDAIDCLFAVSHLDDRFVLTRCQQRGFIQKILEIGTRESGRALGKRLE